MSSPTPTITPTTTPIVCGSGITQTSYVYYDCCGNIVTGDTINQLVILDYTKPYVGITLIYVPDSTVCITQTPTLTPTNTITPSYTATNTPSLTPTLTPTSSNTPINNNNVLRVSNSSAPQNLVNSCDTFNSATMGIECRTISQPTTSNGVGSLAVLITGGTPPYSVYWNNILTNSQVLTNIRPGAYDILVVDSFGDYSARTTCYLNATTPTPTPTPQPTPVCIQTFVSEQTNIGNTIGSGLPSDYPVTFRVSNVFNPITNITLTISGKTADDAKTVGMLLVNPTERYQTLLYGGGGNGFKCIDITTVLGYTGQTPWDGISSGSSLIDEFVRGNQNMVFPSPAGFSYNIGTVGPNLYSMSGLSGSEVNGRWSLYINSTNPNEVYSFDNFYLTINQCPVTFWPNICFYFEICKGLIGISGTYNWTFTPSGTDSTGHMTWTYEDPYVGYIYKIYWDVNTQSWINDIINEDTACRNNPRITGTYPYICPCNGKVPAFQSFSQSDVPNTGWECTSSVGGHGFPIQECSQSLSVTSGVGLRCPDTIPILKCIVIDYADQTCGGINNGYVTVVGSGGRPPYRYSIDYGTTFQSSGTFNGLSVGQYDFMVIDSRGNTSTTSWVLQFGNPSYTYTVKIYDTLNQTNATTLPNQSIDYSNWIVDIQPPLQPGTTLRLTIDVNSTRVVSEPGAGTITGQTFVYVNNVLTGSTSYFQTTNTSPRPNCAGEIENIETITETYVLDGITNTSVISGRTISNLLITNPSIDQNNCITKLSQSILVSATRALATGYDCSSVIINPAAGGINSHTLDAQSVDTNSCFIMYANQLTSIYFDTLDSKQLPPNITGNFTVNWGDGVIDYYNAGYYTGIQVHHTYNSLQYPNGFTGAITICSSNLGTIDTINGFNITPSSIPSQNYYPLTITSNQLKKLTNLNNFIIRTENVLFSGKISEIPRNITNFSVYRTKLEGTTSQLPRTSLETFYINYVNPIVPNITNISGSTADFPSLLKGFTVFSDNKINGLTSALPRSLTNLVVWGSNTISGLTSDLPVNLSRVNITGNNTINGYVRPHIMPPNYVKEFIIASSVANTPLENSQIINDLYDAWKVLPSGGAITLKGTRDNTSNTAYNNLSNPPYSVSITLLP